MVMRIINPDDRGVTVAAASGHTGGLLNAFIFVDLCLCALHPANSELPLWPAIC